MSLDAEWRDRLDVWMTELARQADRRVGAVEFEGFTTTEQLGPDEAAGRNFAPMPPGAAWGGKWEYGWFRARVAAPSAAEGRELWLDLAAWPEGLVFVDGAAAGACDARHSHVLLGRASSGRTWDVLMECYAGHGPRAVSPGPAPPGRVTVPEPPATQQVVGETHLVVRDETAYALLMDVRCLLSLRDALEPTSLRAAEIDRGLKDFTLLVDFEAAPAAMAAGLAAARDRLAPLLARGNGPTVPEFFGFGHAHLDVAWLWPLAETERKCARTAANQLALIERYPTYRFQQSQPYLYHVLQRTYPALFERVRRAVRDGRIIADGATWIEPDTNVPGGEALIRQFLHGRRYFVEELGIEPQVLWLPDVFGYSGALPQILRGCGIRYFSTAKLFWVYHGGAEFPYDTFTWEGIDGSEVLVHLHRNYSAPVHAEELAARWRQRLQDEGISTRLFPFGHGDGGGGPTREHLEQAARLRDLEGAPRLRMGSPAEFFKDLERRGRPEARYVGELYYPNHRGTYTSQARTKRGNRKGEIALREAELWATAAGALAGFDFGPRALDESWKQLLLNQFHDILPGSSIARVYEQAEAGYERVRAAADEVTAGAMAALVQGPGAPAVTVFNSLSWPRRALVALPDGWPGARGASGDALAVQEIAGRRFAEAAVPSCGWTTVDRAEGPAADPADGVRAEGRVLENELLRVELDERGRAASIWDKEADRELLAGPGNDLRMFKDVPSRSDAWDIDRMYRRSPVGLETAAEVDVLAAGPLAGVLRVRRQIGASELTQLVRLRRGSRRVDFETVIDWRETHKLLKVVFPVDVHADHALHEIQFGHIRRANHESRPHEGDQFEVCNHKWTALAEEGRGAAVLNDCKYGVDVRGRRIGLTLLRAPMAPAMHADRGEQRFTYAFYAWNGSFADCRLVREAYELNVPVRTAAGAGGQRSLLAVDAPNVVVEAVKPAEDASGDVVVRLYEAKRTTTRCTLTASLPLAGAERTDMLERTRGELACDDGQVELDLRPLEIATVRLRVQS